MTILIEPFLYLIAFGPLAVLFASVFGLACWLLTVCVRAISLASFTWLQVSARSAGRYLHQPTPRRYLPRQMYLACPKARPTI